jgi:hypothetical protein
MIFNTLTRKSVPKAAPKSPEGDFEAFQKFEILLFD